MAKKYARVYSAQTTMLEPHIIDIEVDILNGLHKFTVVGLPDKAVEESRDRVSSALKNSGFESPKKKNQKIVVALAPANLKKEGPVFDLGIAMAYLLAKDEVAFDPQKKLFLGELSLDGTLRPINGVLPLVRKAKEEGFEEVFVPRENAKEAGLIRGITIYPAETLSEVTDHLSDESEEALSEQPHTEITRELGNTHLIDFSDVKGQESAKRGLEIAAAGGHNIALYGPPGTGKTMLARACCSIIPELTFDDILEVTGIHSVSGTLASDLVTEPPFRSPHHTASYVSMVGGGTYPKPGEVTLAHKGVLFLDEFPEFSRRVIEALRQPLEDRIVSISRAQASAVFPANFILVAAMNPCPCGNRGSQKDCTCTQAQIERYRRKLSGPIVDRIDMWVEVAEVEHEKLSREGAGEKSADIQKRTARARKRQRERFKNRRGISTNSEMGAKEITTMLDLQSEVEQTLNTAAKRLGMSARSYHRTIKLARTIADLGEASRIGQNHILEALQYRPKNM